MAPVLLLAVVAAAMALVMARLVSWASEARTALWAAVVVFLLVMMAAMFLGLLLYADSPVLSSVVLGLYIAAGLMAVSVFPVFRIFAEEVRRRAIQGASYVPTPLRSVPLLAAAVAGLVLGAELVMGRSFALLATAVGGAGSNGLGPGWGPALDATFTSPWFSFPMALEMGATWAWVRGRLSGPLSGGLLAQTASMGLSPTASASPDWAVVTSLASGAIMVAVYVVLAERLFQGRRSSVALERYALALVASFALMTGGIALWWATGDAALLAVSVVVQSALFFGTVVVPERFVGGASSVGADPSVASRFSDPK